MDKRKRNSSKGKGKSKPNGGSRRTSNNRSAARPSRVANRVVAAPTPSRKQVDPVVELLSLLRMNPSTDGIETIVNFVLEERGDYYNLSKAVREIMKRDLTEYEETLVKKLGASA